MKPLFNICFYIVAFGTLQGCQTLSVIDHGFTAYPYTQMAPQAPPPDPGETVPPLPGASNDFAWRPGFWAYNGKEFYWIDGRYLQRPGPTAFWSLDHWEHRQYGWVFVPGFWQ